MSSAGRTEIELTEIYPPPSSLDLIRRIKREEGYLCVESEKHVFFEWACAFGYEKVLLY